MSAGRGTVRRRTGIDFVDDIVEEIWHEARDMDDIGSEHPAV